VVNFGI